MCFKSGGLNHADDLTAGSPHWCCRQTRMAPLSEDPYALIEFPENDS